MVGGIRLITYESLVTLNSGASGHGDSVVAAPPVLCRLSSTTVRAPARARYAAATRPLCPPPMTMASYVAAMTVLPFVALGPSDASRPFRRLSDLACLPLAGACRTD